MFGLTKTSQLIALILETLAYGAVTLLAFAKYPQFNVSTGIFTVLFVATVWVIVTRQKGNPNNVLLVALCLIWVQSTAVRFEN